MEQKRILSVEEVIAKITKGETFYNVRMEEIPLWDCPQIDECGYFHEPLRIYECEIRSVPWDHIVFTKPVELRNCRIHNMLLSASYFFQGLVLENCEITGPFHFDCGGHNELAFPIIFRNCVFRDFADFFDIWFIGPVEVTGCQFQKGTNLGTDGLFDVPPIFRNNEGLVLTEEQ